jgi:peptidyl-prolyl cis-trans isomerase SurA
MRGSLGVPIVAATLVASLQAPAAADPPPSGVVDRIVAVVGGNILLLSDLHAREAPFLLKLEGEKLPPADQAAKRAELEKELLARMIDETLEAAFAAAGHIAVAPEEIDHAEAAVAQQNGISVDQLEEAARKQGMARRDYRAELGRQVLEGKLVQTEILPHVHRESSQSDSDWIVVLEKERAHWLDELRRSTHIDVRL